MIPWLKKLLFDGAAFVSYARASLVILGMVAEQGHLGLPPEWEWIGYVMVAAGVFLRAGEPNPKPDA